MVTANGDVSLPEGNVPCWSFLGILGNYSLNICWEKKPKKLADDADMKKLDIYQPQPGAPAPSDAQLRSVHLLAVVKLTGLHRSEVYGEVASGYSLLPMVYVNRGYILTAISRR